MNLSQSLAAAAAALVTGLSAGGAAPAQTLSQMAATAQERLAPAAIRDAMEEFAAVLERRQLSLDVGQRCAVHLPSPAYDRVGDFRAIRHAKL